MNSIDTVYLHVTRACNLRCVYCYFSAGEPMKGELKTNELISVLRDVQLLNPWRVVFTGGEPLLRNDIIKLAQILRNEGNKIQLCLITNGALVNDKNAGDLVNNFDEVRISVDGVKEINDATRGKGTFDMAMRAFRCIIDSGGDPVAFITVTSKNTIFLKETMQYLLKNGIVKHHISPIKLVGRATDNRMLCDKEELKKIVEDFWYETFGLQLKSERKDTFNCGVGKFLTINPDGSVYPCHVFAFPEFCIGNVRKQSLYSIYHHSTLMKKLRNLHFSEIAQCSECFKELSEDGTCLGIHAQDKEFREELVNLLSEEA